MINDVVRWMLSPLYIYTLVCGLYLLHCAGNALRHSEYRPPLV